jgi:hypothetical protein
LVPAGAEVMGKSSFVNDLLAKVRMLGNWELRPAWRLRGHSFKFSAKNHILAMDSMCKSTG